MNRIYRSLVLLTLVIYGCGTSKNVTIGSFESLDSSVKTLIPGNPEIEIIGEGYEWSEGPVWVESEKMLLFSDVPNNIVYKWTEKDGVIPYLSPSGYTGTATRGGETGSNGLTLNSEGQLVLAQHGDRRIALMESPVATGLPQFKTLAGSWEGKKFNSPNDLAIASNGDIYFTDPPYGLEKQMEDPLKEIPFQGVFKTEADGTVKLLVDSITRPNGIALTPDEKSLIIANSDSDKAIWYIYDLNANDSLINPRIFRDATEAAKTEGGLPDGLKIDRNGNVYASGPGGIWIMDKEGKLLGKIKVPVPVSNCALSDDEKILFLTADNYLLRVRLRN